MSFLQCRASKDSGVPWIGDIPESWEVWQSRRLFSVRNERIRKEDEQLTASQRYGVVPQKLFMELEEQRVVQVILNAEILKHVEPGDFVISMRSFQGGIEYSEYRGCISSAYVMLIPSERIHHGFFKYLFKSHTYIQALQTTTNLVRDGQALRFQNFTMVPLPLPPNSEQEAVANYLDRETAKLDTLIAEQRRLVELLKEKRQAVISHAVTKGLDPHVRMKPSGIEWLGDVPEHWEVLRVKQLTQILRGKFTHRPRNDPRMYDGPYPFIQTGEISAESRFVGEHHQTLSEEGFKVSKQFPSGTLVMTITGAGTANVAILNFEACFPDSIVGFVPNSGTSIDYLYNLFTAMRIALLSTAVTSTQPNLNIERIGSLLTVKPPVVEQRAIVRAIKEKSGSYDLLIAEAERAIALLQERRTALISAAVTGKIDVRGLVKEGAA